MLSRIYVSIVVVHLRTLPTPAKTACFSSHYTPLVWRFEKFVFAELASPVMHSAFDKACLLTCWILWNQSGISVSCPRDRNPKHWVFFFFQTTNVKPQEKNAVLVQYTFWTPSLIPRPGNPVLLVQFNSYLCHFTVTQKAIRSTVFTCKNSRSTTHEVWKTFCGLISA